MKRGAQKGNNNASIGREARHALALALESYPEIPEVIGRMKTLVMLWKPILDKAMSEGDLAAMKEINDRLDGKAQQSIDLQADIVATEKKLTKREIEVLAKELREDC